MWNLKQKQKTPKPAHRHREQGGEGMGKWVNEVKRYKLPDIKRKKKTPMKNLQLTSFLMLMKD